MAADLAADFVSYDTSCGITVDALAWMARYAATTLASFGQAGLPIVWHAPRIGAASPAPLPLMIDTLAVGDGLGMYRCGL